jgi:hypothetical protein
MSLLFQQLELLPRRWVQGMLVVDTVLHRGQDRHLVSIDAEDLTIEVQVSVMALIQVTIVRRVVGVDVINIMFQGLGHLPSENPVQVVEEF